MSIHIFGVRHHGPGCARGLRAALQTLEPDIVLVEGPPDAQAVLTLLMHAEMRPPVALLIYAPDNPQSAVYYPFTHFSPEWQALRYALEHSIPARFMDLPQAFQLGRELPSPEGEQAATGTPPTGDENTPETVEQQPGKESVSAETHPALPQDDPLAMLALAAGYSDHELWWERQIEQ
ncbi:MAG: DUF5682 family protein, partial [Ktedonobacteraceae bacterium]